MSVAVVWMANIQAGRRVINNQPYLQNRPDIIHHNTIVAFLHGRHCGSLD